MKICLDNNAPITNFILGALLSGGDFMTVAKQLAENKKEMNKNKQRIVAKERLELLLSNIFNRSANEAQNLQEFEWMVKDRMQNATLPDTYQKAVTKNFVGQMWQKFQKTGNCLDPHYLRQLEKFLNQE